MRKATLFAFMIFALGTLLSGCGSSGGDLNQALQLLDSDSAEDRLEGLDKLRGNNSPESINAMIEALHDPDARVHHMAVLYLEELGLPATAELSARYLVARSVPILQKDLDSPAYINPDMSDWTSLPTERAVLVFFPEIIEMLAADPRARLHAMHEGEDGDEPLYIVDVDGVEVAVLHPSVGAPMAAMRLEDLIQAGAKTIFAVGGAGVLNASVQFGDAVVIDEAVRDEGTSYHYLPPNAHVYSDETLRKHLAAVLEAEDIPHQVGTTWTTDAFYRETQGLVDLRRSQHCLVVEMEAAAFFAIAEFRGVRFAQMVYGADDLSGDLWDERDWQNHPELRRSLFEAALKAAATAPLEQ